MSEYIYIATTNNYKPKDYYKIGRTSREIHERFNNYSTGYSEEDKFYCITSFNCIDSIKIEKEIINALKDYKIKGELFCLDYDKLYDIVETIVSLNTISTFNYEEDARVCKEIQPKIINDPKDEILDKIERYTYIKNKISNEAYFINYFFEEAFKKIKVNKNRIIIWCPNTFNWKEQTLIESHLLIKKNIDVVIKEIDLLYDDIKFYISNINSFEIDTRNLKFDIKTDSGRIDKHLMSRLKEMLDNDENKIIIFNNHLPFSIGFGDKYTLDLKTKELRTRNYDDYFISSIEYRNKDKKINNNNYCFPICDWFVEEEWDDIQLLFGSFLTGEHDQCFYVLHGEGANGKSTFLNILRILMGPYLTFVSPELFMKGKTDLLEREYNLNEKRLAVLDIQLCEKINETKLIYLTEKYKHTKFILCLNDVPSFTFSKYSTKRRFINIPFKYTFKPEPVTKDEKLIKKNLDINYNDVFTWLLDGCSKYIQSNKTITQLISNYINKINESLDYTYEDFLKKSVEYTSDNVKNKIKFRMLYNEFVKFIKDRNGEMLSEKEFLNKVKLKYDYKRFQDGNYFICLKIIK